MWGVNEIVGLTIASLLASFATTPYAAYHFHRPAPYGVLANLLAIPSVSAWVMPMGILGIVAMPFGFDAECWRQMGYGIEWMDAVAVFVAGLPGAYGRIDLFGTGPLLLATAGLLVMGLLKTPPRWSGAVLLVFAVVWIARGAAPDVLIDADGKSIALRGADPAALAVERRCGGERRRQCGVTGAAARRHPAPGRYRGGSVRLVIPGRAERREPGIHNHESCK